MEIKVKLIDGLTFLAETASGHGIVLDTVSENGGKNLGPSPMELLLVGVAACTAFDIAIILRKMHQKFERLEVKAKGKQRKEPPRIYSQR
ncbi:MAG: OsmC family protein [Thermoproteales archaeon]|nr:OsmC family protein [Thermoproteales archaeon]